MFLLYGVSEFQDAVNYEHKMLSTWSAQGISYGKQIVSVMRRGQTGCTNGGLLNPTNVVSAFYYVPIPQRFKTGLDITYDVVTFIANPYGKMISWAYSYWGAKVFHNILGNDEIEGLAYSLFQSAEYKLLLPKIQKKCESS